MIPLLNGCSVFQQIYARAKCFKLFRGLSKHLKKCLSLMIPLLNGRSGLFQIYARACFKLFRLETAGRHRVSLFSFRVQIQLRCGYERVSCVIWSLYLIKGNKALLVFIGKALALCSRRLIYHHLLVSFHIKQATTIERNAICTLKNKTLHCLFAKYVAQRHVDIFVHIFNLQLFLQAN